MRTQTKEKQLRPAPETLASEGKKLEIETQNPLRQEARRYREATPGYPVDQVTGERTYRTEAQFISDSDDDEEVSGQLAEAGAQAPAHNPDASRDDAQDDDREYQLGEEGTEENAANDDVVDLDDIAKNVPVSAEDV